MTAPAPLAGVRIVEIGGYIAAPYATSVLRSLGAEVIKVEQPGDGDAFRRGVDDRSPYFVQYNAGKKSLAVDLRQEDGLALVRSLVDRSAVLVENLRPGKLRALGLGPERCRETNPALIYTSVTGFGESGPLAARAAYDSVGQSVAGFYSLFNDDGDARLTGTCLADLITGFATATGILAQLYSTGRSGEGVRVDTSMLECTTALTIDAMTQLGELGRAPTRESRHPQAQSFVMTTADGAKLTLHLSSSQKFWHNLARVIGRDDLIGNPSYATYPDRVRNYVALRAEITPPFALKERTEWESLLSSADIPFAPVLDLAQVAEHPQLTQLGVLFPGPDGQHLVGVPWRFDGARPQRDPRAPRLGEHTVEIAGLVLAPDEVERLLDAGVLVQSPPRDT